SHTVPSPLDAPHYVSVVSLLLAYPRHLHSSLLFFRPSYRVPRHLHSFPTRRSSDLPDRRVAWPADESFGRLRGRTAEGNRREGVDRKSTRLNSSHGSISYAVFCLKKKKSSTKLAQRKVRG